MLFLKTKDIRLLETMRENLIKFYKFHEISVPREIRKEYLSNNLIIKGDELHYTGEITSKYMNRSSNFWYQKAIKKSANQPARDRYANFSYYQVIHDILYIGELFEENRTRYFKCETFIQGISETLVITQEQLKEIDKWWDTYCP